MIRNYTVDTWDYIAEGCPPTPKDEYDKRIEICNACPSIIHETFKCSECGCPMAKKAKRELLNASRCAFKKIQLCLFKHLLISAKGWPNANEAIYLVRLQHV